MKKPGDQVDRYVIEAPLGRGGMGEVYEATDTRLGRRVALKLIAPGADAEANQRMLREARAAASFEHPHAVVVYDVGEHDGATFLAMELVRGTPLRALVGDASAPIGRRLRWLVDVARALGAAHRHGIVHRDVKPDNVMIREDGAAKVLDFGIARRQAQAVDPSAPTEAGAAPLSTLTAAGVIVGTPQYAAPEQLRGEPLDGRADEFAWGVMAYELLVGAAPWQAPDSVALLAQILSADPPPLAGRAPDLPEPVAAAVTRALAKRAADRFPTIDEAADAIEPFADAAAATPTNRREQAPVPAATPRPTMVRRVVRGTGRVVLWGFALIGGMIVFGVVAGIAIGIRHGDIEFNGKRLGPHIVTVRALGCEDAKVEGEGAGPEIAQALGRGACARLATQVGVDWGGGGAASKLSVTAKLAAGEASVKLAVDGVEGEGRGPTPIDAVVAASAAIGRRLVPPPMPDDEVRAWGAADATSARRIERVWRELLLNITPNGEEAVKALVASDDGSAWSHMLFALVRPRSTDESRAAIRRGLELVDALPPARAHALRGTFMVLGLPDADQMKEAMRLLRLAYTEAPDDGDVASLYAAIARAAGAEDEAFGVLDRLVARFPTKSVLAMRNTIGRGIDRDVDRDARYLAKLRDILPESLAWDESLRHLADQGRFADARAAIAFGRRLGLSGKSTDAANLDHSQMWIELAALEPKAAREISSRLRGDPRPDVSLNAAEVAAAAYLMEGRVVDAEATMLQEIERQRVVGTRLGVVALASRILRVRRLLGRPSTDAELVAGVEAVGAELERVEAGASSFLAEAALARAAASPKEAKGILAAALDKLDARADKQPGRFSQDGARLAALALVRAVRGDAAAAKLWLDAARAPFDIRRAVAFEAALALDATGQRAAADAAYTLAMDPRGIEGHAFDAQAARLELAALRRAAGKADEAAQLEAVVDRLWQKADPGLRDAVTKLR